MKGKIILQNVSAPAEGMQVVYKNTICKINMNFDSTESNRLIDKRGNIDLLPNIPELKQIAVEYKSKKKHLVYYSDGDKGRNDVHEILPLHPDDWEVAIALIGHEVEFDIKDQFYDPKYSTWYDGLAMVNTTRKIAKLLLSTPVRTIEDIPEELRKFYPKNWDGRNPEVEYAGITGEDLGGLLFGIHTHADLIPRKTEKQREEIYYREKDLLKVLKALGLPKPVWGEMMTVKEWKKRRTR